MKLYETMGDTARCKAMARKIQYFRVKIESPATRDIKNEANEIRQRKDANVKNLQETTVKNQESYSRDKKLA